jgi:hypothetical protein
MTDSDVVDGTAGVQQGLFFGHEGFGIFLVINSLRAILNFTPGPQGITSPLGVKFTPSFIPRGEHSLLFRRMEGRTENFTPRG